MKPILQEAVAIKKLVNDKTSDCMDEVAIEEPLEIQLAFSNENGRLKKNIAVTMRTPGHDEELATGFLFTEAIISSFVDIQDVRHIASDQNRIVVTLKENLLPVMHNSARNFYTTSGCGICGKASIDAIRTVQHILPASEPLTVKATVLYGLPEKLQEQQQLFQRTGGIHASALFSCNGDFMLLREDIGRHNALDKLIGAALLKQLPLGSSVLLLSGRASFELLQKAAMAGISIVAAVGAPSSLAIELAQEFNISLIGFLRGPRFNIYCGAQRIQL